MTEQTPTTRRWRHKKRGTVYEEIGRAEGRGALDDFRNLLVDLAARAVAAVEDHDRRHHRREP
mgnify:CR=1 FL=1